MATLPGQRANFTWALNQYNQAESSERRAHFAKLMARTIAAAPANGFTVEQVTKSQLYPVADVERFLDGAAATNHAEAELNEDQALKAVAEAVDVSDVLRVGEGPRVVYAYGYACAPDRLKVGLTDGDAVQRIAAQISTGTPDRPALRLEIRTHDCNSLERAIHSALEYRGKKIPGAGKEWFRTSREEIVSIYEWVSGSKG